MQKLNGHGSNPDQAGSEHSVSGSPLVMMEMCCCRRGNYQCSFIGTFVSHGIAHLTTSSALLISVFLQKSLRFVESLWH